MAIYYANPSGGGNGTSTQSPWTLSQGFANVVAGDTLYVQRSLGQTPLG